MTEAVVLVSMAGGCVFAHVLSAIIFFALAI